MSNRNTPIVISRMPSKLRSTLRALALLAWLLLWFVPIFTAWLLHLELVRSALIRAFYQSAAYIIGLRVHVTGEVSKTRPLMLVANHASYLDVFVIGSRMRVSFTPKREVRRWPVIGFLCVLADCIFVERRPSEMEAAAEAMQKRLNKGKIVCLFPEGTTSDGRNIKPFKSGFLSLAYTHTMPVQPASIAYTHIGRTPITTDAQREQVAWVGEATFFAHFWGVLGLPCIQVELVLHPAKTISEFADRKALTQACETQIVTTVHAILDKTHAG